MCQKQTQPLLLADNRKKNNLAELRADENRSETRYHAVASQFISSAIDLHFEVEYLNQYDW